LRSASATRGGHNAVGAERAATTCRCPWPRPGGGACRSRRWRRCRRRDDRGGPPRPSCQFPPDVALLDNWCALTGDISTSHAPDPERAVFGVATRRPRRVVPASSRARHHCRSPSAP
jgi:hypothetical protein